jgi:hypothetical protein
MSFRRFQQLRGIRSLGIIWLILGLAPIPLPQVDFHNVRHHDGLGEVCEYHDHLLVWHPDAGLSEDVAVWHCHWLLASLNSTDMEPVGDGPAAHAHIPSTAPVACCDAPRIASAARSVSVSWLDSWSPAALTIPLLFEEPAPVPTGSPPASSSLAPHVSLTLLLQRLTC